MTLKVGRQEVSLSTMGTRAAQDSLVSEVKIGRRRAFSGLAEAHFSMHFISATFCGLTRRVPPFSDKMLSMPQRLLW